MYRAAFITKLIIKQARRIHSPLQSKHMTARAAQCAIGGGEVNRWLNPAASTDGARGQKYTSLADEKQGSRRSNGATPSWADGSVFYKTVRDFHMGELIPLAREGGRAIQRSGDLFQMICRLRVREMRLLEPQVLFTRRRGDWFWPPVDTMLGILQNGVCARSTSRDTRERRTRGLHYNLIDSAEAILIAEKCGRACKIADCLRVTPRR